MRDWVSRMCRKTSRGNLNSKRLSNSSKSDQCLFDSLNELASLQRYRLRV